MIESNLLITNSVYEFPTIFYLIGLVLFVLGGVNFLGVFKPDDDTDWHDTLN